MRSAWMCTKEGAGAAYVPRNARPSIQSGGATPASDSVVAPRSMKLRSRSLTVGARPGARTISGTWVPEAYTERFPRGRPTPWSVNQNTIVESVRPSFSS